MKIALIGASGNVGSRIAKELSDRGHSVTAIARNPEKISALPGVTAVRGDIADPAALASLLSGHEAVVSSVRFQDLDAAALIKIVRDSGVSRFLVVGGAGSLEVAPGVKLIDTAEFPEAYKPEASGGVRFLDLLRREDGLEWTFLSPSAMFGPGERTRRFRIGGDTLLTAPDGQSHISYEDYAVALVDELEKPAHVRQRFTVGY
ncbi:NAD(P)-dependent oxidoreductase [Consotaella salsifontis]|uniref:NAD(P)-binding domain-containing protein n=1 Tax=Consotaella salsifontis TaxID=1365950 RepID=A0A1T4QPU2_9HYPH|nr:NAD(P)-dependent oxidoreductase [Consotaella salsifontis]SKA05779.1 hypothetical protein SAMN05428963_105176 [Consotaella salsifontis]